MKRPKQVWIWVAAINAVLATSALTQAPSFFIAVCAVFCWLVAIALTYARVKGGSA